MLTVETASTYNECLSFTQTKYMDDHTRSEIFATPVLRAPKRLAEATQTSSFGLGVTSSRSCEPVLHFKLSLTLLRAVSWFRRLESPASHRGGPGSRPGQSTWDLKWWTKVLEQVSLRVLRFFPVSIIPP
jgi:hypothetical protein